MLADVGINVVNLLLQVKSLNRIKSRRATERSFTSIHQHMGLDLSRMLAKALLKSIMAFSKRPLLLFVNSQTWY